MALCIFFFCCLLWPPALELTICPAAIVVSAVQAAAERPLLRLFEVTLLAVLVFL